MFVLYETPAGYAIFKVRYHLDCVKLNCGYVVTRVTSNMCGIFFSDKFTNLMILFELFLFACSYWTKKNWNM